MSNIKMDRLIDDVIEWACKADPKDLKKWEHFMEQYLISFGWEPEARKQLIAMGNGDFCLPFYILKQL